MKKKLKKILLISGQGQGITPGQRFRIEQYIEYLEQNSFKIDFSPIMKPLENRFLYSSGNYFRKLKILLRSIWIRYCNLIDLKKSKYDIVFIYRDALMIGSVYFEKQFNKTGVPIIYDFDDAIWLNDVSDANKSLAWLKNPEKTKKIISLSSVITVGNEYLADYVKEFNPRVEIIPTTIDTDYHVPSLGNQNSEEVCIGWTGSITTVKYFCTLIPVLKRLKQKYPKIKFCLIGDSNFENKELELKGESWNLETEIVDLQQIDIGIMPLPDDEWTRGKCGFKALQYMSLEIPCVVSPYGVNKEIVEDAKNGFIAEGDEEWFNKLSILIENSELREKLGKAGRQTVIEKYSVEANKSKWLEVFNKVID